MITIGLKEILESKKISISELHTMTGISRSTLTLLANGESKGIQFETLDGICSALDVDPSDLLRFSFKPNDNELDFVAFSYNKQNKIKFIFVYKSNFGQNPFWYGIKFIIHLQKFPDKDIRDILTVSIVAEQRTKINQLLKDKYNLTDLSSLKSTYNIQDRPHFRTTSQIKNFMDSLFPTKEEDMYEFLKQYILLSFEIINMKLPQFIDTIDNTFFIRYFFNFSDLSNLNEITRQKIIEHNDTDTTTNAINIVFEGLKKNNKLMLSNSKPTSRIIEYNNIDSDENLHFMDKNELN